MPASHRPAPVLPILVTLMSLCSVAMAAVPLINNPAQPANGPRTLQLEELWRIGGEDDEDNLLGVVGQVLADDHGNIYLLDIQLLEVQVFAPDGQYLRSLGRQGDGPGEIRRASDMLFLPDGTLGIVQQFPGRIVKVDLDGLPAGEILPNGNDPAAGGFFALRRAIARGNRVVLSGTRLSREEDRRTAAHFIAPYSEASGPGTPYLAKTTVREFQSNSISEKDEFFPHGGGWTLGPGGRVYIASSRNDYKIDVYLPGGGLERTITRRYESWRRTGAELELARESIIPFRRRNRRSLNAVVEPTERDIIDLRIGPAGRLWVLPSRGIKDQPEGIHSTWDVFDQQGVFTETVSLACEGQGSRDALFLVGGDLAVLVKEHAEAMKAFRGQGQETDDADETELEARPLEVVVYRIANP